MDTSQTSASERIEAARKALERFDQSLHPDTLEGENAAHAVAEALRALITPPRVGESEEQIAQRIGRAHRDEYADAFDGFTQEDADRIALQGVRAGIQSAHESWESADIPSQEFMLRHLGIEYAEMLTQGEPVGIQIPHQVIEREEI